MRTLKVLAGPLLLAAVVTGVASTAPAVAAQARPADGEDVPVGGIGQALRGLAQRLGGTRVGVLAIGRVVSPLQRALYRRTGGRLSLTGRAPVLL